MTNSLITNNELCALGFVKNILVKTRNVFKIISNAVAKFFTNLSKPTYSLADLPDEFKKVYGIPRDYNPNYIRGDLFLWRHQ